jgi:hypothetical protein
MSSGQNRVPILKFPNKIIKWKFSSILYHHLIYKVTNVIKLFKNDHITEGRYIFDQTLSSMIKTLTYKVAGSSNYILSNVIILSQQVIYL